MMVTTTTTTMLMMMAPNFGLRSSMQFGTLCVRQSPANFYLTKNEENSMRFTRAL